MPFGVGSPHPGDDEPVLSDINVTPLVDVMLVLLIIFMITAPMLHQGIEVALPRADAEPLRLREESPIVLSIRQDGMVYVADEPVHPTRLEEILVPMLESRPGEPVFVKGDRGVEYGRVVEVLDLLHRAGVTRIGMVTEKPERGSRRSSE
jgi:biopolymer transport protein TolR